MDNASKALIIAGAILLSILIISLGIFIFNQASEITKSSNLSEVEVLNFNEKFTSFEGTNVRGSEVNSLLNRIVQNNVANQIDESKKVMSDQLENVSEAISNIAKEIEKDQNKFTKESAKIKLLAENNNISIVDLKIKNNDERYLINLYTDKCKDECYIEKIEEI